MQEEYNGYLIVSDGTYGMKEIKPIGKGSVHLQLRGKYTSSTLAKAAIDLYSKGTKGVKGDKADESSRG